MGCIIKDMLQDTDDWYRGYRGCSPGFHSLAVVGFKGMKNQSGTANQCPGAMYNELVSPFRFMPHVICLQFLHILHVDYLHECDGVFARL